MSNFERNSKILRFPGQIRASAVFWGAIPGKCTKVKNLNFLCLLGSNETQKTLVHLNLRIRPCIPYPLPRSAEGTFIYFSCMLYEF